MEYMESNMQDQIEALFGLESAICDDACDIYKETGIMPLDMKAQRDELLEALQVAEKKILAMFDAISRGHGEAFAKSDPDYNTIREVIAKATGEKQ